MRLYFGFDFVLAECNISKPGKAERTCGIGALVVATNWYVVEIHFTYDLKLMWRYGPDG